MQLRVVTDQPWDVKAHVLAIPIVGDPAFDGPLGEIDRRVGGELKALTAFKEITGKRYWTAVASPGDLPAGRVVTVGAGDPAKLDRETVVRIGASAERRLRGREAKTLALWISPLAAVLDGGASAVAELLARGVVEGSFDPKRLYREDIESAPPQLDELILVAPGEDAAALSKAADRGIVIGEGSNWARAISNRSANDVTPDRPRRGVPGARREARPLDRRDRARARPRAGHGHVPRGRPGQRQPAPDDRHALRRRGREGRVGPPPGDRRQGRLLRLRRHQHQAVRPDGRDEDGQDRCLHRDRRHRHRRPPLPGDATAGRGAGRREHARLPLDQAGRRRQGDERQVRRHHEHRRRGPPDPGRRDDLCGEASGRRTSSTSRR